MKKPKSPLKLLETIQEQARIRLEYGPEFIGDLAQIEVGLTPRHTIYAEGPAQLYFYPSSTETSTPILLVYSLINRPYIFDLRPGRSLIEYLTQSGFDVYLLDWGDPTPDMAYTSLSDLVAGTLRRCVRKVLRRYKQDKINILGYCMGATFASLYAGLEPHKINKLVLLTPMLGQDGKGVLETIVTRQNIPSHLMHQQIISGRQLKLFFNSVRPMSVIKKERDFWRNYDQEVFMDHFLPVEKWGNDTPDLPGRAFQEFIELVFKKDMLKTGTFELGEHLIQLEKVTAPVLAVAAKHDWIIPIEALETCAQVFPNAKYTPYPLSGGHIGLVVGRSANVLWDDIHKFLLK